MDEKLEAAKNDVFAAKKELQVLVAKNREAITHLRGFFEKARAEKQKRDEENKKVQELKAKRTEGEKKVDEAREKLEKLDKTLSANPDVENPRELKEKIDKLEWFQQTEANTSEEKKVGVEIKALRQQLPEAEKKGSAYAERSKFRKQLRDASLELRKIRQEMGVHAKKSDEHHTAMIKAFEKAKTLKEKLNEAFKDLDQKRALLATEQKEFSEIRTALMSEEKAEMEKERAEAKAVHDQQMAKVSTKAKDALDKLKSGKKISLEELQAIQQAGLTV